MTEIYKNTILAWLPVTSHEDASGSSEKATESQLDVLLERVLYISGENVVVIELKDKKEKKSKNCLPYVRTKNEIADGLKDELVVRRTVDPFAKYTFVDDESEENHCAFRDKWCTIITEIAIIEPDIYISKKRGVLVCNLAVKYNVTKPEIYKYLTQYWQRGMTKNSLLPSYINCGAPGKERKIINNHDNSETDILPKRGRPRNTVKQYPEQIGVNVDEEIKKMFKTAFRLFYDTKLAQPLKRAYEQMIAKFFSIGKRWENGAQIPVIPPEYTLPSYEQFRYWHERLQDFEASLKKRLGVKKFNLTARAILGDSTTMADGPGSYYQIDATIADVYLVSELDPNRIIGRPTIYFVKDVFSRLIVGIYVGLESPSWTGAMMAIANAASDKVAFCAEYGIEITKEEWPCENLCNKFLGDGGEMLSINSDSLIEKLGIGVGNCEAYRGDMKAIIEREFGLVNDTTIKWVPGAVHERKPGEKDHRLDALLPPYSFMRLIIFHVLEHNQFTRLVDYKLDKDMIADGVEPIPLEMWNWGIVNRTGHLHERSVDSIKLALMPTGKATVTKQGIRFERMYYSCDLALQEQWFVKARNKDTWTIDVSFDPRKPEVIYFVVDDKTIVPCRRLPVDDKRFMGATLEEVQDFFALQDIKDRQHDTKRLQSAARLNAQREVEIAKAENRRAEAPNNVESNAKRTKDIQENREVEKALERGKEAFGFTKAEKKGEPATVLPFKMAEEDSENPKVSTAAENRKNLLGMLKNRRPENAD